MYQLIFIEAVRGVKEAAQSTYVDDVFKSRFQFRKTNEVEHITA